MACTCGDFVVTSINLAQHSLTTGHEHSTCRSDWPHCCVTHLPCLETLIDWLFHSPLNSPRGQGNTARTFTTTKHTHTHHHHHCPPPLCLCVRTC